ncbi:MAG: hypothetical protein GX822_01355 [Alcaligenaceae bacterium]|nr:hypothetical protein [Alcaligenaceae bacterium]
MIYLVNYIVDLKTWLLAQAGLLGYPHDESWVIDDNNLNFRINQSLKVPLVSKVLRSAAKRCFSTTAWLNAV